MSISDMSVDVLKEHVEKAIEQWQNDELSQIAGIKSSDNIIGPKDELPNATNKDHPLNRFLFVVAGNIADIFGGDQRKFFYRQLCRFCKDWQAMIAEKNQAVGPPKTSKQEKNQELIVAKAEKREDTKSSKKTGEEEGDNDDDEDMVDIENLTLEQKREMFEEGVDITLGQIPKNVKQYFGQICFVKWSSQWLPALALSPFGVPPGGVRDQYLNMLDRLTAQGTPQNMSQLVYWYGSSDDPNNMYSFINSTNIISYEEGVKKNFDRLKPKVQKKVDSNKKLTKSETLTMNGLIEMREDLKKPPRDRRGYAPEFKEAYEYPTDDEGTAIVEEPVARKKAAKSDGKRLKKRKKEMSDDLIPPKAEAPVKKAKQSKESTKKFSKVQAFFKPKKSDAPGTIESIGDAELEDGNTTEALDPVAEAIKREEEAIKKEQDEYEYRVALGLVESDKESDDESDEDFKVPVGENKSNKTKKDRVSRNDKELPKKKSEKAKHKISKVGKKLMTEQDKLKKEQRSFAVSEKEFYPKFIRWQKALAGQNHRAILDLMEEIDGKVERIHFSLMTDVNALLKTTKKVLSDAQKTWVKKLRATLKDQYMEKKDSCPVGFKPTRRYPELDLDDTAEIVGPSEPPKRQDSSFSLASTEANKTSEQPSTAIKKVSSTEKVAEDPEMSAEGMSLQKEVKVEKKRFSLGKLMRPAPDASKPSAKGFANDKSASNGSAVAKQSTTLPDWVTGADTNVSIEIPTDERRSFGFEFIRQAVPFVQGKGLNHHSMACALEAAIEAWSGGDLKKYWRKIDDIVVALSGDKKVGTLSTCIAKGEFRDPSDVVSLSDAMIYDSFLGKPLLI